MALNSVVHSSTIFVFIFFLYSFQTDQNTFLKDGETDRRYYF